MSGRENDEGAGGGQQGGQPGDGQRAGGGQEPQQGGGQPRQPNAGQGQQPNAGQGQQPNAGQGQQPNAGQGQATQQGQHGQAAQHGQAPRQAQAAQGPSITDYATNGVTKAYAKFFGATYALVGVAAGLAVFLVSLVGGAPLAPNVAVDPGQFVNNFGAIKNQYYVNRLAYQTINATPVVAALLGVMGGLYVGSSVDGPDEQAYATSAVSTFAGAFVLVLLAGVLASLAIGTIPMPEVSESGQMVAGTADSQQLQQAEGIASAVLIGGTSLEIGGLLINALLTAIATAALAVGGAYVSRELAPTN